MSRIDSSDPLPFTKVDRAVKAKAAVLAGAIDITHQHALGSLIEFWDINGDPREIEKLLDAGKDKVVLDGPEVALRFKIASGKDVDPNLLARVGFLEPIGSMFRVRGMSRYFEPVEKRRQAKAAASAGGKASAAARMAKNGTAQPTKSFEAPFEGRSSGIQAEPEAPPKRARSDSRSGAEAEPEARSNLEVRDQRTDELKQLHVEPSFDGSVAVDIAKPSPPPVERPQLTLVADPEPSAVRAPPVEVLAPKKRILDDWSADERDVFLHWKVACKHPQAVPTPDRRKLIAKWLKYYSVERLQDAITGCAKSPFHQGQNDRHRRFDSLELILRDAKHIEELSAEAHT